MIPSVPGGSKSQRQLLKLFTQLDAENKQHLLAFAEFLASKTQSAASAVTDEPREPAHAPRPDNESVIAAIKRLSTSYSMLNKDDMLHETSDLMSSHVLKGRPADQVIDELEVLFLRHYEKYKERQ